MIQWDERYSIGCEEIDSEHHLFFNLCNKVNQAIQNRASEDWVRRILLEIQRYAAYHFVSEENLMMAHDYPALREHQARHAYLLDALRDKVLAYEDKTCALEEIEGFLFKWLALHVSGDDRAFGQYMESVGILSAG